MLETPVSPHAQRRGFMLLVGLIASVVTFAVGGGIALAHHSEITAAADCSATVTYQAVSWSPGTDSGVNHSVKVWYTRSDTGATTYDVVTGKFDGTNNYRFSGTFAWPAPAGATITVFVQEQVNWGANENVAGPNTPRNTAAISKPTDCTTSIAAPVCVSGQNSASVAVTLTNTSGLLPDASYPNPPYTDQVKFTMTPSIGTPSGAMDYFVIAGSPQTITFSGVPSGTFTANIKVGPNQIDKSVSVNVNCLPANNSATITPACVNVNSGTITVVVSNTGDVQQTFTVLLNDANSSSLPNVDKNTTAANRTKVYSLLTNGTYKVTVKVGNTVVTENASVVINCTKSTPAVTVLPTCANVNSANVVATFTTTGPGTLPVAFVITSPTPTPATDASFSITGPGTKPVTFPGVANGTFTLNYTIDGVAQAPIVKTVSCTSVTSSNSSKVTCVNPNNGTVEVTFTATGGTVASSTYLLFSVSSGSGTPASFALANPGTGKFTVTGVVNGTFTLNYKIDGVSQTAITTPVSCTGVTASTQVTATCANLSSGTVSIVFSATGGNVPSAFVIGTPSSGTADVTNFSLSAGGSKTVTITGVANGSFSVGYSVDGVPKTAVTTTSTCVPGSGSATAKAVCSQFAGTVTITLTQVSGQFPAVFVIDGVTYTVVNGTPQTVTFSNLSDGPFTKAYSLNGVPQTPLSATVACAPKVVATAICNEVDSNGAVTTHWFTLTNNESQSVGVTWSDGSVTIPAGASVAVKSAAAHIDVKYGNTVVASADQSNSVCGKQVTVTKQVVGSPGSGETYTVRVSRLVGNSYVPVLTFNIAAGATNTFTLPSTLDPAGITYKVEETAFGSASVHTVTPDSFTLTGNLGQGVSVVVTNSYASVSITKTVSAAQVVAGEQLTYTLVATNTGGLTLNPVVITDLLPANVAFSSATVAGGGGSCDVANAAVRPQLLSCVINGSLAPGASTPSIDVRVVVDANASADTTLLNQARVVGSYIGGSATSPVSEGALSCVPVVSGTVCNLSAQVSTLVQAQVASQPPVVQEPPLQVPPVTELPVTGSTGLVDMLTIGLVFLGLGGVMLLRRRRPRGAHS